MRLEVKNSVHGLPSVEILTVSAADLKLVRSAVLCSRIDDPVYTLRTTAGAFLQGYDERGGWCLVEFWTRDPARYMPFVDYLNSALESSNEH